MTILQIIVILLVAGLIIAPLVEEARRLRHKKRIERRYRDFKNK